MDPQRHRGRGLRHRPRAVDIRATWERARRVVVSGFYKMLQKISEMRAPLRCEGTLLQKPCHLFGNPSRVLGKPSNLLEKPSRVSGKPSNLFVKGSRVWGKGSRICGEPSRIFRERSSFSKIPSSLYRNPSRASGKPSSLFGKGSSLGAKPSSVFRKRRRDFEWRSRGEAKRRETGRRGIGKVVMESIETSKGSQAASGWS